jgi:Ran GTPase-activating protein (RanGAP) involved in mRNA processing and transport
VRRLDLSSCGLTSHSEPLLAGLIEHSRTLDSLDVGKNQLGPRGVAELAAALQPSSSLRTLRLGSSWDGGAASDIGAGGAAALVDALRRGWRASELRLDDSRSVDDCGAAALASAVVQLGGRCTLTALSLTGCSMTADGALALVRAATHTTRLRTLALSFNSGITSADRPALVAACGAQPHFELNF